MDAAYGERGCSGVVSRCGISAALPNISAEAAWKKRASGASWRSASSRRSTPDRVDLGRRDRLGPGAADRRLRGEVVDLVGTRRRHRREQRLHVGQVGVEREDAARVGCDRLGEVAGIRAGHAVDLVALAEQQLGEVGAVLAGDAGDECALGHVGCLPLAGVTLHIGVDHHLDQAAEADLRLPAEHALGLARIAEKLLDLGGAHEALVDDDVLLASRARRDRTRSRRTPGPCASRRSPRRSRPARPAGA